MLVDFPFTDFSGRKRRPALVVGTSEYHSVVVFITTQKTIPVRWRIPIPKTPITGLLTTSYLRCDKVLSVDVAVVVGGIGSVDTATMEVVDSKLKRLLKL